MHVAEGGGKQEDGSVCWWNEDVPQHRACRHIIFLQALWSSPICLRTYPSLQTMCLRTYHMFASQLVFRLGTHEKERIGKHPICIFLCMRVGTSEGWNNTFVLLRCWLEKGGAYLSSLHFSWAWVLAIFFSKCVSLISPDQRQYHLFIFPST